jgi:hypothetical protein
MYDLHILPGPLWRGLFPIPVIRGSQNIRGEGNGFFGLKIEDMIQIA